MNSFYSYGLYGLAGVVAYKYWANSYVPADAIGVRHGQALTPGFQWRLPLTDTVLVLPRHFTAEGDVDVTISWPGNGAAPLRVMMENVPLRVGDSQNEINAALNVVGKCKHLWTTRHATFDPSIVEKRARNTVGVNRLRYFGLTACAKDYFIANWTHLCRQAAEATSKRLTEKNFAPHVDVAIDVLIEEMDRVLQQQCGLRIDGHVARVSWEDVPLPCAN